MNLLQDLRFAFRQLGRAPGFALTAVVILSLGIAVNVIVFGVLGLDPKTFGRAPSGSGDAG